MRFWILAMVASACTGCTMLSLERHTVAQTDSTMDLRYKEVMDNLAMIANDPSTLPSYASIYSGTITVQDTQQLMSATAWQHVVAAPALNAFASETATPTIVNRQILQNWSIDPIVMPEKLEAVRAACQWGIGGPDHVSKDSMSLLISPEQAAPGPERHFGVAEKLAKLPAGWLGVGRLKDVPGCAPYKGHCGPTWVWVKPDGMKGLTAFTIIVQDIAREDINSQTLFHYLPAYTPIHFETADKLDPQVKIIAQVYVDQNGHLVTDNPYIPLRLETNGNDPKTRSQIAASASAPH